MRSPLAGRRAAARRLAEQLLGLLEPVRRAPPVRLPGTSDERATTQAPPAAPTAGADAAARIDAARERLRADIAPRDDGA